MKNITLPSFAKINIGLEIVTKREDGFHDIKSIFQEITLADAVRVSVEPGASGIRVYCTDDRIPTDERNSAYQAAMHFQDHINGRIHIEIAKQIPMEAGLGGGSSNAATVIKALNHLADDFLSPEENLNIAASIGSDVPFFLIGGQALIGGRGEMIQPIKLSIPAVYVLIVKPSFGANTAEIYRNYQPFLADPAHGSLDSFINTPSPETFLSLQNDLEKAVPEKDEIESIKQTLLGHGAVKAMMTGSGSAVVGYFLSEPDLIELADCQIFPAQFKLADT